MKKILLALILLTASICSANDYVIVTGTGDTEQKAKENAFALAVEQALGAYISSTIEIQNGELIHDMIISKASGFVEEYEILSVVKDGKTFIMVIKAKVSKKAVSEEFSKINHLNSVQKSYEESACVAAYKEAKWCRAGDIALFDMNYGIYADSYALLRQYRSDQIFTQFFFRITLRQKAYFHKVTDQHGKELVLRYITIGSTPSQTANTVSEDFYVELGSDLEYLRKFKDSGLVLTVTGSYKTVTINVPAAYIEGYLKYMDEHFK